MKLFLNHVEEIETTGSLFQSLAQLNDLNDKINVYKQEISQIKRTESFIGRSYLRYIRLRPALAQSRTI